MKGHDETPTYLSYLLRLWRTQDRETCIWRASLEHPGTGERRGFASLEDLMAFLEAQTGELSNTEYPHPKKGEQHD
jgi:hypothetical protein